MRAQARQASASLPLVQVPKPEQCLHSYRLAVICMIILGLMRCFFYSQIVNICISRRGCVNFESDPNSFFVMNTNADLEQALRDFQSQDFLQKLKRV